MLPRPTPSAFQERVELRRVFAFAERPRFLSSYCYYCLVVACSVRRACGRTAEWDCPRLGYVEAPDALLSCRVDPTGAPTGLFLPSFVTDWQRR